MRNFSVFIIILCCLSFCSALYSQGLTSSASELLPTKTEAELSYNENAPKTETEQPWGAIVACCIVGGIIFLFVEAAIIPGFGVTGILGILFLFAGLGLAFFKLSAAGALVSFIISIVAVILLAWWFLYVFPKTSAGSDFILQKASTPEDGYVAGSDKSAYVGKTGVAATMLRPSGIAKIDGERVDVMSDGEFVEKGVEIKVIKIHENTIIVAPIS